MLGQHRLDRVDSSIARSRRTTWIDARAVLADLRDAEREVVVPAANRNDEHRRRTPVDGLVLVDPRGRSGPRCRRSVSSRWSSTCTAVVGSLTAGESARIAMSTMMRTREGRILLDRPLDRRARSSSAGDARRRVRVQGRTPRMSGAPAGTKSPTGCGARHRLEFACAHLTSPLDVERLDRACAAACGRRATGSPGVSYGSGTITDVRPAAAASACVEARGAPPSRRASSTATGRSRWIARSRKRTKRSDPEPEEGPRERHPEVRDEVRLDVAQERVRERRTCRSSTASTALNAQSRYKIRM